MWDRGSDVLSDIKTELVGAEGDHSCGGAWNGGVWCAWNGIDPWTKQESYSFTFLKICKRITLFFDAILHNYDHGKEKMIEERKFNLNLT